MGVAEIKIVIKSMNYLVPLPMGPFS
jgi:hypothetical protein